MNINSISNASFSGGKIKLYDGNSTYRTEREIDVDNIETIDRYGLETKDGGYYIYSHDSKESDEETEMRYQQVLSAYAALQNPSRNDVTIDLVS